MKTALFLLAGAVLLAQASSDIIPTSDTALALELWAIGLVAGALYLAIEGYARKVGGITFLRLGRLQLSFCVTTKG